MVDSTESYKTSANLLMTGTMVDDTSNEVDKILKSHLYPAPSEICQSCNPNAFNQMSEEANDAHIVNLNNSVKHCNFWSLC